jgi:hypothetical protein
LPEASAVTVPEPSSKPYAATSPGVLALAAGASTASETPKIASSAAAVDAHRFVGELRKLSTEVGLN